MTQLLSYIQRELDYTDYQIGQLRYLFEALSSEISKTIIMGVFFSFLHLFPHYCFAMVVLLLLRTNVGGLHFKTYISCFLFSLGFFTLAVAILPQFEISKLAQLISLLLCILINYHIGPIVSCYRPKPNGVLIQKSKSNSFKVVFLYLLFVFIMPENLFVAIGFWVICLQTAQLIVASLLQKRKEGGMA